MEDFVHKLRQYVKSGTPAERRIAKYFSEHLNDLPFETAASVADRLDLSPMTVGRFLRALGYQGLDSVKVEIRETVTTSPAQLQSAMSELHADAAEGKPLAMLVAEQIQALHHIYHLTAQPHWSEAVSLISTAREVSIATHARLASLANHFCQRLTQARDGVHTLDGADNRFADLFARPAVDDALLVIIDCRRFAKARLLARTARRYGYKVILISPQQADWMADQSNVMLPLPPARAPDLDNLPPLIALLDCLSESVILEVGEEAALRRRRMLEFATVLGETANH
ncbi:MurR/RpiR family transcriptional regulator [Rhizobium sp. MC63]|uniref:DNA-binding MurR/RpiR family transcriptional regulator n=2 Tax=Rhizobium TaxID=379 RepID=A0A7W9CW68_9HYPH|nr:MULTISPECIES: MurR/RpiR family transcriptional regulator [Rhizobium]MBB4575380.1 DNA-binding MurR/RpiR family transcriptional regulator [Rhizobium lentis]MBB5551690.1 DNA-binding MurR/RpiR family transcriptional regulator [Rhizobium lentis]MBB5562228.1 DNA-binding MurR/RpiR family transcriptional regulator [Rhizobium lentis]MBB5569061.1 DNA-binding MurR/RpiR family transcriptional regulator [Rhizobium lentis]MDF0698257.1 MurR/RpiR family transcriptional regulator [Rhizobium sp. MC63]